MQNINHIEVEDLQNSQLLQNQQLQNSQSQINKNKKPLKSKPIKPISCIQTFSGFVVFGIVTFILIDIDFSIRQSNQVKNQLMNNMALNKQNVQRQRQNSTPLKNTQNQLNQKNDINSQVNLENPIQGSKLQAIKNKKQENLIKQTSVSDKSKVDKVQSKLQITKDKIPQQKHQTQKILKKINNDKEQKISALPQQKAPIQSLIKRAEQSQKITSSITPIKIADDLKVTAVFVSRKDHISLNKTLTSFYKFNTYYLQDIIVIYSKEYSEQFSALLVRFPQVKWIIADNKLSKIDAIDQAYKLVITPFVFYSDDNYQFFKEGFIQESIQLFKKTQNLVQVEIVKEKKETKAKSDQLQPYQFTFTPGLRKMSDYNKIGKNYVKFANEKEEQKNIQKLSEFYKKNNGVKAKSTTEYAKQII